MSGVGTSELLASFFESWFFFLLGCSVIALALYSIRARPPKGLPMVADSEPFFGVTRTMWRNVISGAHVVPMQVYTQRLAKQNSWRPMGWGHLGGMSGVTIVDPADVKFLLKDRFANFEKGAYFRECFGELLGNGIFNVNGQLWKHHRMAASGLFSKRRLRDRMSDVFGSHAQDLLRAVQSHDTVDIQHLFYAYTFDCINNTAFDRDINSLTGSEQDKEFAEAFDTAQTLICLRFLVPWWKVFRCLNLGWEKQLGQSLRTIDTFLDGVLDAYFDAEGAVKAEFRGENTLIGLFLEHAEEENAKCTREGIRDLVINMLIAGRDTTATTLTSTVQFLCQHPEWQERVAAEAAACFAGNAQEGLTLDDIEDKSEVTQAVVLEAIRLNPAVPNNEKEAVEDATFPSGFTIAAGEVVGFSPYVTNRLESVWGADAAEFKPERWLDGRAAKVDDFAFSSFNAGPRLCLGKNMALLEAKTALLTLLNSCRFSMVAGFEPVVLNNVTWKLKDGLMVNVHPAPQQGVAR